VDVALEDLCKQLSLSGVYSYVQEYSSDNDNLQKFLISALQAELDKRRMNRQMRMISRLRVDQNRIGVRGQIRIGGYTCKGQRGA
jgi:hypothetical protein